MHVRTWVLLMALFLIAATVMGATRLRTVVRERRVVQSGTPVTAKVVQIGQSAQHQAERDEILFVILEYTPPGADKSISASGYLPRKPGTLVKNKGTIDIRIDPAEPAFFTDRADAPPYTAEIGVPLMLLGVAAGCFLLALLTRRSVLHAFTSGTIRPATIVSVKQSPAAPMSKQIGFTLDGSNDVRIYQCFWPNSAGAVTEGQQVDVIVPADPTKSLAAAAYGVTG